MLHNAIGILWIHNIDRDLLANGKRGPRLSRLDPLACRNDAPDFVPMLTQNPFSLMLASPRAISPAAGKSKLRPCSSVKFHRGLFFVGGSGFCSNGCSAQRKPRQWGIILVHMFEYSGLIK
jgi:hypothetical protein